MSWPSDIRQSNQFMTQQSPHGMMLSKLSESLLRHDQQLHVSGTTYLISIDFVVVPARIVISWIYGPSHECHGFL